MSEHNPFAAPVGAAVAQPTNSLVPSAFTPPIPTQLAPAAAAPPAPPAPAEHTSYDHPAMTLTELSFAPVAPPAAAEAPAPAPLDHGERLVNDVLPSGGVTRSLRLGGGRVPMVALILVALLAAAGVVFGTGLLGGEEDPPAPIKRAPVGAKPLLGAKQTIKAKTGTLGRGYVVTKPAGFTAKTAKVAPKATENLDVELTNAGTKQRFFISSELDKGKNGAPTAAELKKLRADLLAVKGFKGAKITLLAKPASVAGVKAAGFDIASKDGKAAFRVLFVRQGGVVYAVGWVTPTELFVKSTRLFDQIVASVKFDTAAKPAVKKPAPKKK